MAAPELEDFPIFVPIELLFEYMRKGYTDTKKRHEMGDGWYLCEMMEVVKE